jgi:RNA polymerase sigma-70 factor (ECF subfamily)
VRPSAGLPRSSGTTDLPALPADDDALMALLAAGDARSEAALGLLYDRYAATVYGLALRLLGDAGRAERVLQETFWRLWRYPGRYEPGRVRFATWLLRSGTSLALDEIPRGSRRPPVQPAGDERDAGGGPAADQLDRPADGVGERDS